MHPSGCRVVVSNDKSIQGMTHCCWPQFMRTESERESWETPLLRFEASPYSSIKHDDVIKWKHFPCYWPFVPVNSLHKGQWHVALMFSLICVWINGWVNNREAADWRSCRANYDVTVIITTCLSDLIFDSKHKHWNKPRNMGHRFHDDGFIFSGMLIISSTIQLFDKNGDYHISASEILQVMQTLGDNLTEDEVDEMIQETDIDGDEKLNFEGRLN